MESRCAMEITKLMQVILTQRKDSYSFIVKLQFSGGKRRTRTNRQHRALKNELCIKFRRKLQWISETTDEA